MSKLSGALWRRGVKRKESLQLCLWNLNSTSNSPVAPRRRSTELSDFRQSARSGNERECKQTSKNTCQGWWLHYYLRQSAFRIVIASFRPAARAPQRACSQATADMVSMFIISSSCKCKEETLLFSVACIITMRLLDSLGKKKKKRISKNRRYHFMFPKADRRKLSSSFNLFHRQIFYKKNLTNWKDPKRQIERYGSFTPEHYLIIHSVDCLQTFFFFRVRMGSCRSTRETPSVTRVVILCLARSARRAKKTRDCS